MSNLCLYLCIFQDSFVFYAQLELKLSGLLLIHLSLKLLILYTDFLHIVSWSFFVQYLEVWLYEVQTVCTIILDMIAIPDFSAGAMENWGLITYRETAMLYDPVMSSESNKQRVVVVITHELAHQVNNSQALSPGKNLRAHSPGKYLMSSLMRKWGKYCGKAYFSKCLSIRTTARVFTLLFSRVFK